MATGDVLSCTVGSDGWYVDLVIEGFTTGATYNFGLDGNNGHTAATPFLTVVSEGFSTAGVLGTISRRVYLTTTVRQPYPNQALTQETAAGGNLTVRVALSEFVYTDDKNGGAGTSGTDPVLTAPAGMVTSGGTPSNTASLTATNSSTLVYPKVIGNWSRPDRERLSTQSVTLGAVAFHGYGRNQRPVACVKFTAGNGTQTASVTRTSPEIDAAYGDPVKVVEYLGTVDLTGFTDDTLVTCDFVAYPWIGDASSVLDTAALAANEMTGQIPRQYYVLDVDGSRGYPIVVVDSVNGDDTRVYTTCVFGSDTTGNRASAAAAPVKTLFTAMRRIYDYNNAVNGRANAQGGIIYVTGGGTLSLMGGTVAVPTTGATAGGTWTWVTVKPLPGGTATTLVPDATSANRSQLSAGVKFSGCTIQRSSDVDFLRAPSTSKTLFDQCAISDTRATNTQGNATVTSQCVWYTRCTINYVTVVANSGRDYLRGNTMPNGYPVSQARTVFLGCDFTQASTAPAAPTYIFSVPSSQANDAEGAVVACNKFRKLTRPLMEVLNLVGITYTRGFAIVQNLVELLSTGSQPALFISGDGTTSVTRDCVIWHNTIIGQRVNLFYNDTGTVATLQLGHSVGLNALEYYANKGDTFNDPTNGPQTARQGNWSVDNGVLNVGNRIKRGVFNQRFPGFWSAGGTDAVPMPLGFVNDQSGPTGAGGGDYRPTALSALQNVAVQQLLQWDIDGASRNTVDAAGAYAASAPQAFPPGMGFFAA